MNVEIIYAGLGMAVGMVLMTVVWEVSDSANQIDATQDQLNQAYEEGFNAGHDQAVHDYVVDGQKQFDRGYAAGRRDRESKNA